MATGQISRRHRLVAADLARENAEVLRESEEATAAAKEEVFGLVISWRRRLVIADLAGENAEVLRESEKKKPPPPRKRKCSVWSVDVVDEKDY
ncbi:uncharacterized protein G2W53_014999 [Senna tora]|uniref:Uncharacterized protein n=1 Tax=Senna tora TaxID=362788 RepID=A0A835C7B2_9FABA|nr:uncharacterized protein G2W53_014999 [Senna tora]